jgi:hypothetical protein
MRDSIVRRGRRRGHGKGREKKMTMIERGERGQGASQDYEGQSTTAQRRHHCYNHAGDLRI